MKHRQQKTLAIILLLAIIAAACWGASRAVADAMKPVAPWENQDRGLPWATLNATQVNFREGPGEEYRVVQQWSSRIAVEILSKQNGWVQVLHWTNPNPMWVWGEYLDFV